MYGENSKAQKYSTYNIINIINKNKISIKSETDKNVMQKIPVWQDFLFLVLLCFVCVFVFVCQLYFSWDLNRPYFMRQVLIFLERFEYFSYN